MVLIRKVSDFLLCIRGCRRNRSARCVQMLVGCRALPVVALDNNDSILIVFGGMQNAILVLVELLLDRCWQ